MKNPGIFIRFAKWTIRHLGPANVGDRKAPVRGLAPDVQQRHDAEIGQWKRVTDKSGRPFLVPADEQRTED